MARVRTISLCAECGIHPCTLERALDSWAACPDCGCENLSAFLKNVPLAGVNLEILQQG